MKILNSTKLSSEDLRTFFNRCVSEVDKIEKPTNKFSTKRPYYRLTIKNSTSGLRGRAGVNRCYMMIKVPTSWSTELSYEQKQSLARIIIHEYYHNLGFKYWDKRNYQFDTSKEWVVDWVKDYKIGLKDIKPTVKVDIQQVRYERAKSNYDRAVSRFNRAKTLLNKWKSKVKYYEVELAKKDKS